MKQPTITDWQNCYEGGWQGIIVPEAFGHPAKFSYSLICRMVRHGIDQGYWRAGDTIGDCFGGVALGGIVCGYHGLNWIGVELEKRFCELGSQNIAMHEPRWRALETDVSVKLMQGDSRRFAEIVGQVAGVVSSPPFSCGDSQPMTGTSVRPGAIKRAEQPKDKYGSSPGQIGALKAGALDGVVSSPPYEGTSVSAYDSGVNQSGGLGKQFRQGNNPGGQKQVGTVDYGGADGQIGREQGETYWSAMHAVYASVHASLKPGAIAAWVLKDYVSKGQRVPLCDQTCQLLESLGFEVFERCRCWLVKHDEHPGLFGEPVVKTTARKSFFRRLAESKGSPAIDWEEVVWCRRKA